MRDRAELLRARVSRGALAPDRLRLAAYLGAEDARLALGADAPRVFTIPNLDTVEWTADTAGDLPRYGKEACARVAVALGRPALDALASRLDPDHYARIFASAEAFVRQPTEAHAREAEAIASSAETTERITSALPGEMEEAVHAVVAAASVAGAPSAEAAADDLGRLIAYDPGNVRRLLHAEVVPWALGDDA